jgi:thiamine-phosphate pyrophosphorylase
MEAWARQIRLIGILDARTAPWAEQEAACRAALGAGLPALMLRDRTGAADEALLPTARRIAEAARVSGALVIVNRRLELARAIGAGGIHLGKEGPSLAGARATLGAGGIVGYSAHTIQEALAAFAEGFDYVTFSPIFETPSKAGALPSLGLEKLQDLCERAPGPVVALGGIDARNASEAIRCGAAGVAMIRGVFYGDAAVNVRALFRSVRE